MKHTAEPDDIQAIHIQMDSARVSDSSTSPASHETGPLDAYRKSLFDLHKNKSNQTFSNESEPHAAVVYEVFFTVANNYVRVFCERLKESVFGQPHVVKALKEALARGVHVEVVTEKTPDPSEFLDTLKSFQDAGLSMVQTLEPPREVEINFCVVDDEAFRWEHDNDKTLAIGRMHDPEQAKALTGYFVGKLLRANEGAVA